MRRFLRSITDLSLFQQLSFIVITFGFTLLVFFGVYLRGNINDFVESQVMEMLQRSQDNIIKYIESNDDYNTNMNYDREVTHFVFNKGKFVFSAGGPIYQPELLDNATAIIKEQTAVLVEGKLESGSLYYYRCTKIDRNRTVISVINESYALSIESSLLKKISDSCAIVICLIFIIVMFWAISIISPLQQIRNYITKVRKGEKAVLNIDRKDEIGELGRELVSLQEELHHQEETKEEMIHNISHDLKTPIATIKSYAESIKDGIYPYDTLEKSVDVIIDNADRLEQKVYSLLFLNRLDYMMEQAKETEKICNMKETIETVILSLKMIRPEIEIVFNLEEVEFRGDEESWRVVVENLLDNSLRYAEKRIEITLKPEEMWITNDGEPISEERMQRLFKPFEKGTKGKFGLGLSICAKVAQAYDYSIGAENLEKGVIFRIKDRQSGKKKKEKNKR